MQIAPGAARVPAHSSAPPRQQEFFLSRTGQSRALCGAFAIGLPHGDSQQQIDDFRDSCALRSLNAEQRLLSRRRSLAALTRLSSWCCFTHYCFRCGQRETLGWWPPVGISREKETGPKEEMPGP